MKVSSRSWHFRLWIVGRDSWARPRDLCRYFWHLFLIKMLLPAVVATLVLLGIGFIAYIMWSNPVTTAVVIGLAIFAASCLIILYFVIKKLVDRNDRLKKERAKLPPEPEREPSILFMYLAARKRKICPLIEVVEDVKTK